MALDTNFLSFLNRTFTPPDPQQLQQGAFQNALLRSAVQNAPLQSALLAEQVQNAPVRRRLLESQANQNDLETQLKQQQFGSQQDSLARGQLSSAFDAIAQAPDDQSAIAMYSALLQSPQFQQASKYGIPVDKFTPFDPSKEKPQDLRNQAKGWSRYVQGGGIGGNLLKTFTGDNGQEYGVSRDGRVLPLGVTAAQNYSVKDVAGAKVAVGNRNPGDQRVLSTAPQENAATQARAAAETTGKGEGERTLDYPAAQARLAASNSKMDRLAQSVNEILNDQNLWKAVGLGRGLAMIPSSAGADVKAKIDALQSQVGLAVLQDLRDNSKTGGAVGQVSNFEQQLFQNNLAAIGNLNQSPESFRQQLQKILDFAQGSKERLGIAFKMTYPNAEQQAAPSSPAPTKSGAVNWNDLH